MTTPTTWKEAFGVLQRNAATLRNQQEPDLDNLLSLVTESMDAYKVCKARISAVEKALEQALGSADDQAGVEGRSDPEGSVPRGGSSMPEEPPGFMDGANF